MANPAMLPKLPGVLTGRDPALFAKPMLDPQLACWGLAFLGQCTASGARRNTLAVLQLALRSRTLMDELRERVPLAFSFRRAGKLVMLSTGEQVKAAEDTCAAKRQHGCDVELISTEEACQIEPALTHMKRDYVGAVHSVGDEVGDALAFSEQLTRWLASNTNTEVKLGTNIRRITARQGKLATVETDRETLCPDAVVVCLGAWSGKLLKPLGVRSNIYPIRGYSITLPANDTSNSTSLTDLGNKIVFSRLGEQVRIAGFADFVGFDTRLDGKRTRELLDTVKRIAPRIADYDTDSIHEWGGFRPVTPDSRPTVGVTPVSGVYQNTGHGMLGWTLACVTGHELASRIGPAR